MDSAKALANKVHRGELKRGFTVRDIYRKNWSMLSTPKEAADAVEVLIDAGWLRPYTEKQPGMDGRPTVRFCINPRLRMAA